MQKRRSNESKNGLSSEVESVSELLELIATCRSGWTLPGVFYCDPLIFHLDRSSIFNQHWLFAGHVSQIPRPGDYFTYDIGKESLIIVRDGRQVCAYFNVCRHRGSRILTGASGHAKRLVCPYHQWTYSLDGKLVKALSMPETFEPMEFGLHRAAVRTVEGLIFVCLTQTPPDFSSVESDLREHLQVHELATAKVSSSRSYQVHANWKILNENARECYHCPAAHPEYCRTVVSAGAANSTKAMERVAEIQVEQQQRWRASGLAAQNKPFRAGMLHSVNRFALAPGVVTESLDGQAVAPLMGKLRDSNAGVVGAGIYPNFLMEALSDYAVTLRFTPLSAQLTEVTITWYINGKARPNVDYISDRVEAVWRATAEQDWRLCEMNQQGVDSSRYCPGPYATNEWGCDHFDQWYVGELSAFLSHHPCLA